MKFDLIVSNPPYESATHLQIHQTLATHCLTPTGTITFVHPMGFLLSHKLGTKPGYIRFMDTSKLERIHMFWANDMFNIYMFVPLGVSTWRNAKTDGTVHVVDDAYGYGAYDAQHDKISLHGPRFWEYLDWFDANVKFPNGNLTDHGEHDATEDFHIKLSTLRGHPPSSDESGVLNDDYFTILPKNENDTKKQCQVVHSDNYHNIFSFKTQGELDNFIKYLKTKCVRFLLSLSKANQMLFRGELNRIPWLDFTKERLDADLRVEWNIDDDLWHFIDNKIPDYYTNYQYERTN